MSSPAFPNLKRIVPFWERLPAFFLFPLAFNNLIVIGPLALASLLAFVMPLPRGIDLMVTEVIIWITALRHAFRAMDLTAYGHVTPAAQEKIIQPPDPARVNLPWKMIGLFIILGLCLGTIESMNEQLADIAGVLLAIATPAIIMQLCDSNSLPASLNPGRWWHFMRRIGLPYLVLCFFLLLLMMGGPTAMGLVVPLMGKTAALPAVNFVLLYFNLIMFYMMGYVMYQYHDELGLAAIIEFEENTTMASDDRSVDTMVAARLSAGQMNEAVEIARNAVRNEPESLAAHERLYTLLITAGDRDGAARHAIKLFGISLAQGRTQRALSLYQEAEKQGQPFELNAWQVLPLARAASTQGDQSAAIQLVRGFDKRYPGHADIPAVYLFSAQLLSEQYRRDEMAMNILQGMLQRYPEHALADEARRYLEVLRRMAAIQAKPAADTEEKKPTP